MSIKSKYIRTLSIVTIFVVAIYILGSIIGQFQYQGSPTDYYLQAIQQDSILTPYTLDYESPNTDSTANAYNLDKLVEDFIQAESYLHQSLQLNRNIGLKKYYTDSLIAAITQNADQSDYKISVSNLSHNLHIHLLSTDHKVVVLTDSNQVSFYTTSYNDKVIQKEIDSSIVRYVMLMQEGTWHVHRKKILRRKSTPLGQLHTMPNTLLSQNELSAIRGMNYYPRSNPWQEMWTDYSPDTTARDLRVMKFLGINTVRIFIPYFHVKEVKRAQTIIAGTKDFLHQCHKKNIAVMVTLFDFYNGVEPYKWGNHMSYIDTLVHYLGDEPGLKYWDLKNEADLDFKTYGKATVLDWAQVMSHYLKKSNPQKLVTLGWSQAPEADMILPAADFESYHSYTTAHELQSSIAQTRKLSSKPILISEVGRSTYHGLWRLWGYTEENRSRYFKNLNTLRAKTQVPFMVWTLYDFDSLPEGVFPDRPWIQETQKTFGIMQDLKPTASAEVLRSDSQFETVEREFRFKNNLLTRIIWMLAVSILLTITYHYLKRKS